MLAISIIIPVYNRPEEISALLKSLCEQSDPAFEVIIVEDGSQVSSENVVVPFKKKINLTYHYKVNSGPGLSRNYGAQKAKGNYYLFFDSDCEIPPDYIAKVRQHLSDYYTDAYGGPDRANASFSPIQKAINYAMTSFITTGGIRGQQKRMEKFHPRSFNMGFSKTVFEQTGGFSGMRFGEDVELSIRVFEAGFSAQLIEEAYVYHKRRTSLRQFFKQVYNSGIARINLFKLHPHSLKIVHFLPAIFLIGCFLLLLLSLYSPLFLTPIGLLIMVLFLDALVKTQDIKVTFLSIVASFIQLTAYGAGFIAGAWNRLILKKKDFKAFSKTFYE